MFVFPNDEMDFKPNEIDLKDDKNYKIVSSNLFRVQKLQRKIISFAII